MLSVVIGSGSKDKSKGCAVMSEVLMFFSISMLDNEQMYLAVERAGCKADAHESCMMLCAFFLLISLQLKVWSPQQLCCLLHLHVGVLLGL
jgi:hypothetical protein